jgi:hypothetical protein
MAASNRRFTMLDGMILIAASAIGFWLTKVIFPDGVKWEELPWTVWGFLRAGLTGQSSREYWIEGSAELSLRFLPSLQA